MKTSFVLLLFLFSTILPVQDFESHPEFTKFYFGVIDCINFNTLPTYHTRFLAVDKVRYTIIPIKIGTEYTFLKSKITPFVFIEGGYNYSSSETEGKNYDGIAGTFNIGKEIIFKKEV